MADYLVAVKSALSGRYAIERELGQGGMATVYLATDLRHARSVAVKVLRPELGPVLGSDRFLREVRVVAQLNHPHILPLYDSGEADGLLYYVMPHVAGGSLRALLDRSGPLPVPEALDIARQVAAALEHAHARGIVHRDIKPENILLHEGEAMVADFGIALAPDAPGAERLTGTGLALGSAQYMSPEQAVGERTVDARSDVYSLGAVLYEMLAGEPPYTARTAQGLLAKRLTEPVPPIRRARPMVPAAVETALGIALASVAADRFPSAAAFSQALDERTPQPPHPRAVAVLPFVNLSPDPENEFFADGITEDVITQLSKIRALRVISRTSVMAFKKREQSLKEIAARLEVQTVVEGSVRRAGNRVRIVAQLIDAGSDRHLWAETYDRELTDIFAIQSDVALHIADALRAELSPDEHSRIRRKPTDNLEAYQLYLQGRQAYLRFTREGWDEAIAFFEHAVARDPDFGMAHAGLAQTYVELGESGILAASAAFPRAKQAVAEALRSDPGLGDAHRALAYLSAIWDYDWERAEREFRRALELNPSDADAYDLYARMCSAQGRHEEALVMVRRAKELDPLVVAVDLATTLIRAGRYEEAVTAAEGAVAVRPGYDRALATLGWAYLKSGRTEEGLAQLERAVATSPEGVQWHAQLGHAYAITGQPEKAREMLRQLEGKATESFVAPYHLAFVHTGLGELDKAMDLIEQAFTEGGGAVYGIKGSFLFTPLHGFPRFEALLRRMNLA
ncbi:MAG: protein kinase [Gemmatimonadetes bacterium]|nr:protein kinase [Gemmatimonadota bacterium]